MILDHAHKPAASRLIEPLLEMQVRHMVNHAGNAFDLFQKTRISLDIVACDMEPRMPAGLAGARYRAQNRLPALYALVASAEIESCAAYPERGEPCDRRIRDVVLDD